MNPLVRSFFNKLAEPRIRLPSEKDVAYSVHQAEGGSSRLVAAGKGAAFGGLLMGSAPGLAAPAVGAAVGGAIGGLLNERKINKIRGALGNMSPSERVHTATQAEASRKLRALKEVFGSE